MEDKNVQINTAFIEGTDIQFAWDSVSLSSLKTCARKYYLEVVQGWQKKGGNTHLDFGINYHSALETYDKVKFSGHTHEEAVEAAVKFCLRTQDTDQTHKDYNLKNRFTLTRAVVWYLDHFADDAAKTVILDNGKPAVELTFKLGLNQPVTGFDKEYIFCGHLDRLVEFGDDYFVLDRKTTKGQLNENYFAQFNPNNQMTGYIFAGQVIAKKPVKGAIMDAAQLAVGFSRFARTITTRTQSQLNEWYEGSMNYIRLARQFAENKFWPMNETACDKFGGCVFRDICKRDPSVRAMHLNSDFEKRIWNPLIPR